VVHGLSLLLLLPAADYHVLPQVLRDGVWHLVQPLPGAFTINVGVSGYLLACAHSYEPATSWHAHMLMDLLAC
jgi:hypothetical protein